MSAGSRTAAPAAHEGRRSTSAGSTWINRSVPVAVSNLDCAARASALRLFGLPSPYVTVKWPNVRNLNRCPLRNGGRHY